MNHLDPQSHYAKAQRLIFLLSVSAVAVFALMVYQLWAARSVVLHAAEVNTLNVAKILETRVDALLRRSESMVTVLSTSVRPDQMQAAATARHAAEIQREMGALALNFPEVQAVRLLDANGMALYSSDAPAGKFPNYADRAWFQEAKRNPVVTTLYSDVFEGRLIKGPIMVVARPMRTANGVFYGAAVNVISLLRLQEQFQSLDVGEHGSIALRRSDTHKLVVRWPHSPHEVNKPLSDSNPIVVTMRSGVNSFNAQFRSEIDGTQRIFGIAKTPTHPFYLTAGFSQDEVLSSWSRSALAMGATGVLLLALMLHTAWRLWTTEKQRMTTQLALQAQQRDLELANQELARSNADLEQFAYVASHDLQEPLRSVASCVQLLELRYSSVLDDRGREFIAHANRGSQRMQAVIGDLLAYSRVGSGGKVFTEVDTQKTLDRAREHLAAAIAQSQGVITADALPSVQGDAAQITQLFQNLVGNALKFRGDKPAVVHIAARPEGSMWVFSVADQGIGIEPQYFDKVFKLFQRLHARGEYAGTGIGLTICQKIVARHGGRIWVESQPGVGTTFFFTLPDAHKKATG